MTNQKDVLFECEQNLARITLNRPEVRNALSLSVLEELRESFRQISQDPEIRVVILSGSGDACFCAGADLKERLTFTEEQVRDFVLKIRATMNELAALPQPTIAYLNGHAFGGGLEMALACDFRVLSPEASVGLTETSLAIIPGAGGCVRLPSIVGFAKAKELILTAKKLSAKEALECGLVHKLGSDAEVQDITQSLMSNGPLAVQAAKAALDGGVGQTVEAALQIEAECYERIVASSDRLEALQAFAEKRKPRFEGR